jgi:hypothetical protein
MFALFGGIAGDASAVVHYNGTTTFHFIDVPGGTGDKFTGHVVSQGPLGCHSHRSVQVFYVNAGSPSTQVGPTALTNGNGNWVVAAEDPNTPVKTGTSFYALVAPKTLFNGNICRKIFSAFKNATSAFMTDG